MQTLVQVHRKVARGAAREGGCVEFCPSELGTREVADLPRSTAKLTERSEYSVASGCDEKIKTLWRGAAVDAFTQRRVSELRNEITALRDQNQTYRMQTRHTLAQSDQQDVRRLRLLVIKEELARMIEAPIRGKRRS